MKTAAEDEVHGAVNMTTDNWVVFQIHQSNAETEATTCSITDMDCVANEHEREIESITSKAQMQFKQEFSIRLIEFEA